MKVVIFEDVDVQSLYPLTLTRTAAHLRIGIDTLKEKWERLTQLPVEELIFGYLAPKYNSFTDSDNDLLLVNSRLVAEPALVEKLLQLDQGKGYREESGTIVAVRISIDQLNTVTDYPFFSDRNNLKGEIAWEDATALGEYTLLRRPYDIFLNNRYFIEQDFKAITAGRMSAECDDPHTKIYYPERVFIEDGAKIRAAIINPTEEGYIYIGKDAEIQEGAIIHGSHAICEKAVVIMGAKLRGDSTIGYYCKIGGEVANSVFISYTNKAHDGFIGNAVIGSWCNLGANTVASNLKNTYAPLQIYNYQLRKREVVDMQFCGPIMGDHTRTGIQTMLNTASVIGVCCNIFGDGFPPTYLPSFIWGGASYGWTDFWINKALEAIERMMARRDQVLTETDVKILEAIYRMEGAQRERLRRQKRPIKVVPARA